MCAIGKIVGPCLNEFPGFIRSENQRPVVRRERIYGMLNISLMPGDQDRIRVSLKVNQINVIVGGGAFLDGRQPAAIPRQDKIAETRIVLIEQRSSACI